jgi:hypothetical protein
LDFNLQLHLVDLQRVKDVVKKFGYFLLFVLCSLHFWGDSSKNKSFQKRSENNEHDAEYRLRWCLWHDIVAG